MSVWVFKEGKKELIAPELLDSQLAVGWSVTERVPRETVTEPVEPAPVDPRPDIAGDSFFGFSNQAIRDLAKEAGIEHYRKLRIHTLKEKLDYERTT